jgi:hypothetical protein
MAYPVVIRAQGVPTAMYCQNWFWAIVYQERNSRAVHREFEVSGHGLADDVGMIRLEESYREHRTGEKRPKKRHAT